MSIQQCRQGMIQSTRVFLNQGMEEKENYFKVFKLVTGPATDCVRHMFYKLLQTSLTVTPLSNNIAVLEDTKSQRRITVTLDDPKNEKNAVAKLKLLLDPAVIIPVLLNLTTKVPPLNACDKLPPPTETSMEADIKRIRFVRNLLLYTDNTDMAINDFKTYWSNLYDAISRQGGTVRERLEDGTKRERLEDGTKRERLTFKQICDDIKEIEKLPTNFQRQIDDFKQTNAFKFSFSLEGLKTTTIQEHTHLDVFSSTSYLASTLRSVGLDIPSIKLFCFIRDQAVAKQLPLLDEFAKFDIVIKPQMKDLQNTLSEENVYVRLVVLEPNTELLGGKMVVELNKTDCDILSGFMHTSKSLEYSIFVVNKNERDYDLITASKEIATFLKVDNHDIFKRLFDSKDEDKIEERVEACFIHILTTLTDSQTKGLPVKKADVFQSMNHALQIHEFKTVALRHESVNGFGRGKHHLSVILKKTEMAKENDVREYLKKFLSDPPKGFKLFVEHRERLVRKCTRLEQGSKVRKNENEYGSIGMFLKDESKVYFTTCAHVIREGACAYSSKDNSLLGKSVLSRQTPAQSETRPWLDFSLVQIDPKNDVECNVGLKTLLGEGTIFRGDVLNVNGEMVYKYGAKVRFVMAECYEVEEYTDGPYWISVYNADFGKMGDSGSIIFQGEEDQKGSAIFIFTGIDKNRDIPKLDRDGDPVYYYETCKVQDALGLVAKKFNSIKPCTSLRTENISSQAINGDDTMP